MEDPRFLRPAEQVLGEGALPLGVDANRYVGGTGWHSDHPKAEDFGFDAPVEMECAPPSPETPSYPLLPDARSSQQRSCCSLPRLPARAHRPELGRWTGAGR